MEPEMCFLNLKDSLNQLKIQEMKCQKNSLHLLNIYIYILQPHKQESNGLPDDEDNNDDEEVWLEKENTHKIDVFLGETTQKIIRNNYVHITLHLVVYSENNNF